MALQLVILVVPWVHKTLAFNYNLGYNYTMILVRETTHWEDVSRQPNHTYIMDDSMSKSYGYFKWNNPKDFQMFSKPIKLDTRYRKFKVIQRGYKFVSEKESQNKSWVIKGSKDQQYVVEETENGYSCSCIGFKYHGKCKHIEQVKNESQ